MDQSFVRLLIPAAVLLVFLYVFAAVLAPVLMQIGYEAPAKTIYRLYSPLCHQLAYRSWFLFGMQAFYPLSEANAWGFLSYEQAFKVDRFNFDTDRSIIGNEIMGYKIALCQRDLAIYSALLLFGLVFLLTGRKIKRIRLVVWLLLGVAPLGLDGLSQLFSYNPSTLLPSAVFRESTPFLRTITGAAFGFFTGWYIFPSIQSLGEERKKLTNNANIQET